MFLEYFLWLLDFFRCTPKANVTIRENGRTTLKQLLLTLLLKGNFAGAASDL